jgi:hypothetical protein
MPDLPIVASFRALAAGALERRRHDPASVRASTGRPAIFFRCAPFECRFAVLRNDISTEGQPSLTDS